MSYIHQALKKAQTERDEGYGKYAGILLSSRSKRPGVKKWTLIAAALLGILFLAFVVYSWLDRGGHPSTAKNPPLSRDAGSTSTQEKTADVEALYRLGKTHHKNGRPSEAKTFYEKALKADPGCVSALNNLGVLLMAEKDYPAARIRFEKAIRLNPDYVDACYNLACLFALTDQPGPGLRYLKRAVSLNPQVKAWAREDGDLETLRKEPGFRDIVDG